ncbi:MAG TPA: hypothetical protein GXX34_12445 [Clostridia bacterium]|nr:hypothetical protein [Clostridia bacterium]
MSKNKGKSKAKKAKSKSVVPASVVRVSGRLANILDHVKQALYHEPLTYEELYRRVREKLPLVDPDKLERDLKRCLGNNVSFYFKNNRWQMDKTGSPGNDPFYQYLMTLGYPVTFRELRALAEENGYGEIPVREQDFAYDGRFIRLKNGKWGLTYWQVSLEVSLQDLQQVVRLLQRCEYPLDSERIAREVFGIGVTDTNLEQALHKDQRFLEVAPGLWYLKSKIDALIADITAPDEFSFIRQAEISALQEAELMLIIEEADASKREYIVSSWDLEKGVLRLSKRLAELFEPIDQIAYLKVKTGNGELGVWFLKEQRCLAGLRPWFEEYGLEPGSKVEVSRDDDPGYIKLKASGEREAEVFAEGLRVKKLVKLKKECAVAAPSLEEVVTEILQLYPDGLDMPTLSTLVMLIQGAPEEELSELLDQYPYYERDKHGIWSCNVPMRQAYHQWQKEREEFRRQIATATEDYQALLEAKTTLEEELAYLQDHHRQEEALFQAKIEELSAANEHLALENSRLKNECSLLEARQKELLEHVEHQGSQLVALRAEKNKLKVKLEQLENRAMQLQSTLNQLMEDAHQEVERLKRELAEKTHQMDSLQYANKELQKNLARLHEERRQMKRQISSWPIRIAMFLTGLVERRRTIGG